MALKLFRPKSLSFPNRISIAEWRVLIDRALGQRFNSPNDSVVKSDRTIWFTDPSFGLIDEEQGYGGEQ